MNPTPAEGTCAMIVHRRRSIGVMGKGRTSYTALPDWCGRTATVGDLCSFHAAKFDKIRETNRIRKEARS